MAHPMEAKLILAQERAPLPVGAGADGPVLCDTPEAVILAGIGMTAGDEEELAGRAVKEAAVGEEPDGAAAAAEFIALDEGLAAGVEAAFDDGPDEGVFCGVRIVDSGLLTIWN